MKKLFLLLSLISASILSYAQGPNSFGGIALRVNDTTTYQTNAAAFHTAGYYDIYFNNQATNDHWDVWNGSSYDHIFAFNSGGGAGITDGDKGEITVTASGLTWTIDNGVVTNAKINDVAVGKITGLGTGVATWLATPSSANARAAYTDESGTGAAIFADGNIGAGTATTAAPGDNDTSIGTTAFVTAAVAASTATTVGTQDLYLGSPGWWPRLNAGCAVLAISPDNTNHTHTQTLDFDQTTQEFAQISLVLPAKWNNGTVTAIVHWTASAGTAGQGVVWGVSGRVFSNDDPIDDTMGTAQTTSDTYIVAGDLHVTSATSAITIGGTPQDRDLIIFQISRNPADGSDTLAADAKLIGVTFIITTDAGTD